MHNKFIHARYMRKGQQQQRHYSKDIFYVDLLHTEGLLCVLHINTLQHCGVNKIEYTQKPNNDAIKKTAYIDKSISRIHSCVLRINFICRIVNLYTVAR